MAKSKNNVVTFGLSGKIGDLLIFSQRGGKTIVSKITQRVDNPSEKQKEQRRKFQQAVIYGRIALADPDAKAAYQASAPKGQTAYNVAIADMFRAPDIETIDFSGYTGKAGDTVRIVVKDDFLVKEVRLSIVNDDGTLVEEGNAASDPSGHVWIYTATQTNANLSGDKITVTVSDLPGNQTQEEQTL
jgi:hypothetical protein